MPEPVKPSAEMREILDLCCESCPREPQPCCMEVRGTCDHAGQYRDNLNKARAAERDKQETRLTYCKTHRTIVPAFKDHPLSCCVLADAKIAERKKWWKAGWRAGQEVFKTSLADEADKEGHDRITVALLRAAAIEPQSLEE